MSHEWSIVVPEDIPAARCDRILAQLKGNELTRSAAAKLLREGLILVNGSPARPSTLVGPGDSISRAAGTEPPQEPRRRLPPAHIHIPILFEDEHIIVVDKPAGISVHPGAGGPVLTMMDILLENRPEMAAVGEPERKGVVHRLDKDTTGVMLFAKSPSAYKGLSAQFKEHSIRRIYYALVRGTPGKDSGVIDAGLGRHPKDRKRMSTAAVKTRTAVTHWKMMEAFPGLTLLEITPETGRTHQIRAHLASVGLPIVGDPVYGKLKSAKDIKNPITAAVVKLLKRQALHAHLLGFDHPVSGRYQEFSSAPAEDMAEALAILRSG